MPISYLAVIVWCMGKGLRIKFLKPIYLLRAQGKVSWVKWVEPVFSFQKVGTMSSLVQRESFFPHWKNWSYWVPASKTEVWCLISFYLSVSEVWKSSALHVAWCCLSCLISILWLIKNISGQKIRCVIFNYSYTFRVYKSGSAGPVLLLLHGGGHSALSWAVFTVSNWLVVEVDVSTITAYFWMNWTACLFSCGLV